MTKELHLGNGHMCAYCPLEFIFHSGCKPNKEENRETKRLLKLQEKMDNASSNELVVWENQQASKL